MTPDPVIREEPWEAGIGAMLQEMPTVEPPAGFIDDAVDHRPLHAGRILASMVAATVVLIGLVAATGVVERAGVVPPIDDLVTRHDVAARAGFSGGDDDEAISGPNAPVADSPVSLPEGFRPEGTVAIEDLRQALYARGDESVSIFVQDRPLEWSGLPDGGLTELGGLPAWVDGDRRIAIVETAGSTVTVVGLAPAELEATLREAPRSPTSVGDRIGGLAEAVAEVFGYRP